MPNVQDKEKFSEMTMALALLFHTERSKKPRDRWVYALCFVIFMSSFGKTAWAQEVYFAEPPPMELDGDATIFTGYTIEYSAKNHGVITLELWNKNVLIGKGNYLVRRRGSNTAHLQIKRMDNSQKLIPGNTYHYKLIFEQKQHRIANIPGLGMDKNALITGFSGATLPKKINTTKMIRGVSVVQK